MKFALVGVGGAGGRLVEHLLWLEANTDRDFCKGNVLAFDTTKAAFEQYDHIPLDRHVLVGDTHPDIAGEGLEGDVDLGAAVANEDVDEIHREFDKLALHEVDAVVMCAGLGGGTGGGVGPVLLENLQAITDNPVFVVGMLPAEREDDQVAVNAARALQSYVRLADNVILFDNETWLEDDDGDTFEDEYDRLNDEFGTRIMAALAAGELASTDVAENRVDSSDLARTLETGGVSTIGFAQNTLREPKGLLERLLRWFRNGSEDEASTDALQLKTVIRNAATGRLTLPCEIDSAERGLIVLSGPPEAISRKGFESGRYWLEQETDTVEILAGDEPRPKARKLSAVVLLTNVTAVQRIEDLQQRAVAAKRKGEIVFSSTADGSPNPKPSVTNPEPTEQADTDSTDGDEPVADDTTADDADNGTNAADEPTEQDDSPSDPDIDQTDVPIEEAEPSTAEADSQSTDQPPREAPSGDDPSTPAEEETESTTPEAGSESPDD